MNQLDIHNRIDEIVKQNPSDDMKEEVFELINKNFDARDYFFAKADERWLKWLWENGFLDTLKTQPDNTTKYSHRAPEINYIVKVAEKKPKFVVEKIILCDDLATTEEKFNPELIDRILRLCGELPAEYLPEIIEKIKKQNWVKLLSPFGHWGFEFKDIFESLLKAGDEKTMLELAGIVLSVKTREEFVKEDKYNQNPFYIRDFSYTKVFDYLQKVSKKEDVLKMLVHTISNISNLSNKKIYHIFAQEDVYHMLSVNFFTDEYKSNDGYSSYRESVEDLMLFTKDIAKELIEGECAKGKEAVQKLYQNYIGSFDDKDAKLPDTKNTWQLRLYLLSLCPQAFKDEIKKSLFRLFNGDQFNAETCSGAEYESLLRTSFAILSEKWQKEYVNKLEKISRSMVDQDGKEVEDIERHARRILCIINEKDLVREIFGFDCPENLDPRLTITFSGATDLQIKEKAPISYEEFARLDISEIAFKLANEWTPENIKKLNEESGSFHSPITLEGVSGCLRKNISERFEDYLKNAQSFFNPEKISSHYTFAYLRGVSEALEIGCQASREAWDSLLKMFLLICQKDLKNQENKSSEYWLVDWRGVYKQMAEVLEGVLLEKDKKIPLGEFAVFRENLLDLFKYLLEYPNPVEKAEILESAENTIFSDEDEFILDPFNLAVNSVRGRAFQAFLMFIYLDGKDLEEKKRLKNDVKELYEKLLSSEKTRAMMFMYGHFLPNFYYRDSQWARKVLIPKLFGCQNSQLALASEEGYLSQKLYREVFEDEDIQDWYKKWIKMEETKYTNGQKHWRDVDKALAVHLALAFVHFDIEIDPKAGFENDLLKEFWLTENKNNLKRHKEFISFIAGTVFLNDAVTNIDDKLVSRLKKFWEWIIREARKKNSVVEKGACSAFGGWVNKDREILPDKFLAEKMAESLCLSEGEINNEFPLLRRLPILAEVNPESTYKILEKCFLGKKGLIFKDKNEFVYGIDNEIKEAFKILLSKNEETKGKVENLISRILEVAGKNESARTFWPLVEVVRNRRR